MKFSKFNPVPLFLVVVFQLFFLNATQAQSYSNGGELDLVFWFGLLELPFLAVCVYYSFKTAAALKGGIFGKGMLFLAWGFLVMAIGHLAMQIHHIFGVDIFRDYFGLTIGSILWFVALIVTWGLSAFGFYQIYKVSKGDN